MWPTEQVLKWGQIEDIKKVKSVNHWSGVKIRKIVESVDTCTFLVN